MQKGFNGILLIPFFIFTITLKAQLTSVSPYSKIGIGDLYSNVYSSAQGFAGANLGLIDKININYNNPASYAALDLTTFELGFQATSLQQRQLNPDIFQKNGSAGLRYFAFAVPVRNWWGASLGLQPFSFKGFSISTDSTFGGADYSTQTNGSGGLNQVYFGNAFKVAEGLSLGINTSFIFGKLEENDYIVWENGKFLNSKVQEITNLKGLVLNYGLQYQHDLANDREIGIGITYANSMKLNSEVGSFAYSFKGVIGLENPVDSTATSTTTDGKITLPSEFGFGISYGKKIPSLNNRFHAWMLNADFHMYNGSEFVDQNGFNTNLVNGYRAEIGGAIKPKYAFKNLERSNVYWSKIEYRLGGFYENTPYQIGADQIVNYGMTFGIGLPVTPRGLAPGEDKVNTLNMGLVLGRRGSTDNGLIQENYLNFYLGVTLNDKWFIKYKYR